MEIKVIARPRTMRKGEALDVGEYPYEVVPTRDGVEGQPILCRNREQCLCVGNGLLSGMGFMQNSLYQHGHYNIFQDYAVEANVYFVPGMEG